jgi:hypothetical protein
MHQFGPLLAFNNESSRDVVFEALQVADSC